MFHRDAMVAYLGKQIDNEVTFVSARSGRIAADAEIYHEANEHMQWNAKLYDQKHAFVTRYGEDVVALLAPQIGERVLDVGCGTGHLTAQIADNGAHVVGMDSSEEMISVAQQAHPNLKFVVGDAADFSLETLGESEPFDAIFSNAALHWVTRMEDAVVCMAGVLRLGGRLVVEFGGKGNIEQITHAFDKVARKEANIQVVHGRVYPSIAEYSALLERHGFLVRQAELFDRPTKLEDGANGLRNWLLQFNRAVLAQIPVANQDAVIAATEESLRNTLFKSGSWFADYRRLRIVALKNYQQDVRHD
jgi:trans-aconitate methyltransferase